jgi:hypothetical protein
MRVFFRAADRGFYIDWLQQIPADVVEIPEERYLELISSGRQIVGSWNGQPVIQDVAVSVADLRAKKISRVNQMYEAATSAFKSNYPPTEIEGWQEQVRALDAFDADPTAANPLIDILAEANGRTRAQMAEAIRNARNRFVFAYAKLTGLRQQLESTLLAINVESESAAAQIAAVDETLLTTLAQQLQEQAGN